MAVSAPFKRTCRQFSDGSYANSGQSEYITQKGFAVSPHHYINAFLLIQSDFVKLLSYVEPADANLQTYSYRIQELLLRTCIEVEANCKAILIENGYQRKPGDMKMNDYFKIEKSHRLSSYLISFPTWTGDFQVRQPFKAWGTSASLSWYKAYNTLKHDRFFGFHQASFGNLTEALCGLVALLSAQFWTIDFIPGEVMLSVGDRNDGLRTAIGGYFGVQFPEDWPLEDRYDFSRNHFKNNSNAFQDYPYNS